MRLWNKKAQVCDMAMVFVDEACYDLIRTNKKVFVPYHGLDLVWPLPQKPFKFPATAHSLQV